MATLYTFESIPTPRLVIYTIYKSSEFIPFHPKGWHATFRPHPDDWGAWCDYCDARDWYPLFSGRLAWIGEHATYLRGARWISTNQITGAIDFVTDRQKSSLALASIPDAEVS